MVALVAGDSEAFEELVLRYERQILTLCYSFLRERTQAEDMAQETFLRVFRHAARYRPEARFSTWLYKIASNLCLNEIKKTRLRQGPSLTDSAGPDPDGTRLVSRLIAPGETPLSLAERNEAQRCLEKAIDHLPDEQRTTLILVEHHHLSYKETADVLEVTVSAVKMRMKRARETLRELLKHLAADSRIAAPEEDEEE
jgi:RNA polymerase sigma-70 factor (ECF subfamily)